MKIKFIFLTMIAAAVSFSCQSEIEPNGGVNNESSNDVVENFVPGPGKILAMTPTATDTKIAFGEAVDGKLPVVWSNPETDKITLYSENDIEGKVYVHNGSGSAAVFTGEPVEGEKRYAVFPATRAKGMTSEGMLNIDFGALAKQDFHSSLSGNGSNLKYMPMWAKESEEGVFAFQNLCGAVMFRFNDYQEMRDMKIVSVTISSKENYIAGNAVLNPEDGTFAMSGEIDAQKEISISYETGLAAQSTMVTPSVGQVGKLGYIVALPVGEYAPNDLTVTIKDSYGRTYSRTVTSKLVITPGVAREFPTLSFTFAYGEANSVVVEPGKSVTFDAALRYSFAQDFLVKNMSKVINEDGSDFVEEGLAVDALWEIAEAGTALTTGAVIEKPVLNGNQITVTAKEGRGNALVVLKDAAGTILWSWHIWVVDGLADLTFADCARGTTIHNMNLGATQNSLYHSETSLITNQDAMGLYYQYGRKDPFVMPKSLSRKTSSPFLTGKDLTSRVERDEETKLNGRVDWTIKNPDARILRSASTQAVRSAIGFSNWTYAADDLRKYWHSTEKTIYDPCPKGYKVPDYAAFEEFDSDKAPAVHVSNVGYLFGTSSTVTLSADSYDPSTMAYFPNSGFLLQGTMEGKTHTYATNHMYTYRAFYWTTTPTSSYIRVFPGGATGCHVTTDGGKVFEASMGSANNIRCLKIQ